MQCLERTSKPQPRKLQLPEYYAKRTLRPLRQWTALYVKPQMLNQYHVTLTELDFETGRPLDTSLPTLLYPAEVERTIKANKPWIAWDGKVSFYDFDPEESEERYMQPGHLVECAHDLSYMIWIWMSRSNFNPKSPSLYQQTPWEITSHKNAIAWLGCCDPDVHIWKYGSTFQNFMLVSPDSKKLVMDSDKPHIVCHCPDSAPFPHDGSLRTSELKTIAFMAAANNCKAEYNHLDYFCVTVLSFWYKSVRIVQGLVNLRTGKMDVRVSPVQCFDNGVHGKDGSIDPRFLKLIGYNVGHVPMGSSSS